MNSFNANLGKFYTLLHNTDPDLSYFDLSYVFLGHNDSVERVLTVLELPQFLICFEVKFTLLMVTVIVQPIPKIRYNPCTLRFPSELSGSGKSREGLGTGQGRIGPGDPRGSRTKKFQDSPVPFPNENFAKKKLAKKKIF